LFAFGVLVMAAVMAFAPSGFRPTPNYNDYLSYYKPPAVNLLAGKGYLGIHGHTELHDPPGYPLLLAFEYGVADLIHVGREGMVNVATILILALSGVLIYRVGRAMFGLKVGVLTGILWITYPIEMLMAPYRFSEVPFTSVLYLTALIFVDGNVRGLPSWRRMAVVGALVGVDALIRPQAILLVVPYALALWLRSRQLRRDSGSETPARVSRRWGALALSGVLVLAYVATLAPWEGWVKAQTGKTVALSDAGPPSIINGLTVGFDRTDERGNANLPSGVAALEKRILAHQKSLTTTGKIAHYMFDQLQDHPVDVIELVAIKAGRSFYGTNSLTHESVIAAVQAPYLILMVAGLILAWRSGRWRRWLAAFIIMVTVYMWVMTISVLSIVRYMGPTLGLLLPFAALTLVTLWEWARRRYKPHPAV
jgi:Dolichyl-phosphate-mannose-protein mannosyltransferase